MRNSTSERWPGELIPRILRDTINPFQTRREIKSAVRYMSKLLLKYPALERHIIENFPREPRDWSK